MKTFRDPGRRKIRRKFRGKGGGGKGENLVTVAGPKEMISTQYLKRKGASNSKFTSVIAVGSSEAG